MNAPSVSVVIPSHNRRRLLSRALVSVLAQTRPAEEVIVIDDGSTDGTAEAIAEELPEVRLVRQDHAGVSRARNLGIGFAHGDWIAFLDSDDEWLPHKLEQQVAVATDPRCPPLIHCDELWLRNGRRVNPRRRHRKHGGWIYAHCLPLCCISPSAAMIRRDVLLEAGGFDETLPACEDYDLWLRLCCRHPVELIPQPLLIKHGGHADQLSRRYPAMDRFRIHSLLKMLANGDLDGLQREQTLATLEAKARVYVSGARRRGHDGEAARIEHAVACARDRLMTDTC